MKLNHICKLNSDMENESGQFKYVMHYFIGQQEVLHGQWSYRILNSWQLKSSGQFSQRW